MSARPRRLVIAIILVTAFIGLSLCVFLIRKSRQVKAQERARAGEIYLRSGQTKKAITAYKQALRFDRANSDIWRRLAIALEASNDLPEAIKAYERVAEISPDEARIQESLGRLLDRAGMSSAAKLAYSKALSLYTAEIAVHPTYGFLYKSIGDLEQRLGDSVKAAHAYQSASEYYTKNDEPGFEWEFLGDAWLNVGKPDDAVAAYQRASKADPDSISIRTKLRKLQSFQTTRPP